MERNVFDLSTHSSDNLITLEAALTVNYNDCQSEGSADLKRTLLFYLELVRVAKEEAISREAKAKAEEEYQLRIQMN
jgi:hypothetical protein